ncbi:GGDEF domain-containing protein [Craterilacuibacter sp.]|uniref:GGDEF domain-containing protein n=1 Tax=Craterilacuibacter sp. TaxID=2870909 RepID=UPI003F321700
MAAQLESLYKATPLLISLFDDMDRLRYANPAFRHALALAEHDFPTWMQLMRDNHRDVTGTAVATENFETWLSSALSRRGKVPYRSFEADMHDGRWILMTETVDAEGWMLCCGVDISAWRAQGRELRAERDIAIRVSQTDELTGVSNRRHILDVLAYQLHSPHLDGSCIAMFDLDHFKRVNDSYGHPFGDRVLRQFALLVQSMVRRSDGFGRLGGEEFMLVLRGIGASAATDLLERVLGRLRLQRCFPEYPDWFYTCSAGATVLQGDDTLETAYKRADDALYRAKQAGRDGLSWG